MDRFALFASGFIGLLGAAIAPRFAPTAGFAPLLVFFVCSLGAFGGLWVVSYALRLD